MSKISNITCHRIINSRSDWTIETHVELENGVVGVQTIPSGASKGEHEAVYVPVDAAVEIVEQPLNDLLVGKDAFEQQEIDSMMIEMDGTDTKEHLGGNSILSVSLAVAKACAKTKNLELYEYLSELAANVGVIENPVSSSALEFPTPVFNILNGGKHANNNLSFQEFMVIPNQNIPFDQAMNIGVEVYQTLKNDLQKAGHEVDVGDEGGFAPDGFTIDQALNFIRNAASREYLPGKEIFFGMDVAAESFFANGVYNIKEQNLEMSSEDLSAYYGKLLSDLEIIYLEDPFYERDLSGWRNFYQKFNNRLMIVGDDLVVTNPKFLRKAIDQSLANAVIVKPNQVGTLTETFEFIKMAKEADMELVVSHRSGDTAEDTFIADLALAVNSEFLKAGAPARGERVAKYNRLLDIFDKVNG